MSATHKLSDYLPLLGVNGTMILVGIPTEPYSIGAAEILMKRIKIGK